MRTVRIKVYKFSELNEKAQKKALIDQWYINVENKWWNDIYQDAAQIGLVITDFDIGRSNFCYGELSLSLPESYQLIIQNHGESCETHKTAKAYLSQWSKLVLDHSDGINIDKVMEGKERDFDELADVLEKQFKNALCSHYLEMLREDYEKRTSEDEIKETILEKKYEFTIEGQRFI